ncbi:hypothetical protein DNTS_003854 [Danionella cerebrum]|uniref:Bile salt-activated lipase n=1 Tax=Danionella cerebrum TaxID=2873325 RepID=A0A553QZB3_9TELE|nr:hypothetical protein DNTS_003854 [Danionella translucida]
MDADNTTSVSGAEGINKDPAMTSGNAVTLPLSDINLVCVEYPAVVKNVKRMLQSIGGEEGVSKTYADSTKRLELRFRPGDPFCYPAYGNRYSSTNLLLRVRRRTRKANPAETQISTEIVGIIGTTYKFQGMVDFQYLASHSNPDGAQESLYDKIILRKPETKDYYDRPVHLFLPPAIFSRMDTPVDYNYRPDVFHNKDLAAQTNPLKDHLIAPNRTRRPNNAIFINFEDKNIPMEPLEGALFEKRPIWSRNAVKANVSIHPEKMKHLLPYVAYYMITGPWRSLWIRFGYDPRKTTEAKIYQVLDFRIRYGMKRGFVEMPVKSKRSTYHYTRSTTINRTVPQPASVNDIAAEATSSSGNTPASAKYLLKESVYTFRKGTLPPYRQMFYQLCDLDVQKQDLIHKNDGKEDVCDEKDGWCLPQTADQLRNIISKMIHKHIQPSQPVTLRTKRARPKRLVRKDEDDDDSDEEDDDDDTNNNNDDDAAAEYDNEEEYKPSDGSDNEMETEIADYFHCLLMMAMLGVFISVGLFLGTANAASLGAVLTEGGMVQGKSHSVGLFRYMDVFKGIPFAAPPGRLEKPVAHPGWEGVLKADDYRKRCLQVNLLATGTVGSEDCLYLNIWVPQGRSVSSNLPVMVFIYGGAFLLGAGQGANFLDNYLYDGTELADRGNVIVVTFNYRVGALGFLSTGDADAPGNYGLWDQHAAIAWVHRNIKAFGGNPDNLTIFGESAGSASVSLQMLSPKNKGLFKKAISQSGVALCPWAINRNPRKNAEDIAREVGCPTDSGMVACLKRADPKAVTLAGKVKLVSSPTDPIVHNLYLSPVIDGELIPAEPDTLFGNTADISYIAGVNDMDGHMFAMVDIPSINNALTTTPVEDVQALATSLSRDRGQQAGAATYQEYTINWGSKPGKEEVKKTVVEMETDFIFLVPTQAALYLHVDNAKTAKTYSFLFTEPSRIPVYPLWMGADHADDLQYVFGKPFSTPLGYFPRHRDTAKYMIAYWSNFAQTGDPNKGESNVPVTWPEFSDADHKYLDINNNMNRNNVMENLRASLMIKALALAAIALAATFVMLVQDPSDTLLGGGYPELWRRTGLAGAPARAAVCILAGVFLLAMGWLYRLLFAPLELLRGVDDVGYIAEDGRSRAQAANEVRRRRKTGELPPVYPNGWYRILDSHMLERGDVKSATVLGQQVAVFRGQDGKVHVVDAYCPHLGANLAVGGRVVGGCIECPFHGWQFRGVDGKCVKVPYADKVPEFAKVRCWPSCEINGLVLVWFHCDGLEPSWRVPEQSQITCGDWVYRGRTEHFINAHIEEIPENAADIAHLAHLHTPGIVEWKPESEPNKHCSQMLVKHALTVFGRHWPLLDLDVLARQVGPGLVFLLFEHRFLGRGMMMHCVTPVEPLLQCVSHTIFYQSSIPPLVPKFILRAECIQFERDVMIWNNKTYISKPLLVKEDSAIQKHRRWYSQFYSENSPRLRYQQDTLEF